MLLFILRLESLFTMLSLRSSPMIKWLKWPRPMRGLAMNINNTSKLTQHPRLVTRTPSSKLMLLSSLFRKRGHVANVEGYTTTVTALHTAVGGRTIGLRCVEQEVPHPGIHPPHTSHRTDRGNHWTASSTSNREEEDGKVVASSSRKALPTRRKEALPRRALYTRLIW